MIRLSYAKFLLSAPDVKHLPPVTVPEIALVGRSNVGKSSLINGLTGHNKLAQTSNTPGKTRMMNYYELGYRVLDEEQSPELPQSPVLSFRFVDLPGYGYAKVSKTEKQRWGKALEGYLSKRESLQLVIQCIDARIGATEDDVMMGDWLAFHQIPTLVVITKCDKASTKERDAAITRWKSTLTPVAFLSFSAKTGMGKEKVWRHCHEALSGDGIHSIK